MVLRNPIITTAMLLIAAIITLAMAEQIPHPKLVDILSSYGLPIGIFPKSISSFSQDMSGRISYGKICNLTGVWAQELFLWLPVKGIEVDIPRSGLIYLDVQVVSKHFSLSLFETPKDCSSALDEDMDAYLLQIPI